MPIQQSRPVLWTIFFDKRTPTSHATEMGGGFLSLTPLVGDVLLDRYLSDHLQFLRTVPEIRSLGVTTNGAMMHRFGDAELATILPSFDRLSLSIYGTDASEYATMT